LYACSTSWTRHVEVLSVPVGGTAHYKNLEIGVARCVARPPTLAPDAAAWLDLRDTHPDGVAFHGWMLAAEPALGVLESPPLRCTDDPV
jgi:hypothetical protein